MKKIAMGVVALVAAGLLATGCGNDDAEAPAVAPGAACVPAGMDEDDLVDVIKDDGVELESLATTAMVSVDNFLVPSANARGGGGGGGRSSGGSSRSSGSRSSGSSSSSGSSVKSTSVKTKGGYATSTKYSKFQSKSSKYRPGSRYPRSTPHGTYFHHYSSPFSAPWVWFFVGTTVNDDYNHSQAGEMTCTQNTDQQ